MFSDLTDANGFAGGRTTPWLPTSKNACPAGPDGDARPLWDRSILEEVHGALTQRHRPKLSALRWPKPSWVGLRLVRPNWTDLCSRADYSSGRSIRLRKVDASADDRRPSKAPSAGSIEIDARHLRQRCSAQACPSRSRTPSLLPRGGRRARRIIELALNLARRPARASEIEQLITLVVLTVSPKPDPRFVGRHAPARGLLPAPLATRPGPPPAGWNPSAPWMN